MSRVFANAPRSQGSIPGQVIPEAQKMVLDAALLNTQHYKVRIKCKLEQPRGWSRILPNTEVANFSYVCVCVCVCVHIHIYISRYTRL